MDNDIETPLKNLPDLPTVEDGVEELITLSIYPRKLIAKKTTRAYVQAAIVAATAVPLLTVGGPTLISQAPARKPDMESTVPSSGETYVTLEGSIMLEAIETSAGSAPFSYRLVKIQKKPDST